MKWKTKVCLAKHALASLVRLLKYNWLVHAYGILIRCISVTVREYLLLYGLFCLPFIAMLCSLHTPFLPFFFHPGSFQTAPVAARSAGPTPHAGTEWDREGSGDQELS